jgi:hypothetical protein
MQMTRPRLAPFASWIAAILLLASLSACKKAVMSAEDAAAPEAVTGVDAKAGAFLAYEHTVSFEVAPDTIEGRISALQAACNEERFGACSVLSVESSSGRQGHGSIAMRVVPAAVEKLVQLGGAGAPIANRRTHAEDLADAVADVASSRDLLTRQRATLLEFIERKDLAVADMITLSERLAAVDSQLQSLSQDAAQQRRRIETNHLKIDLTSNVEWEPESDFSLGDAWETFTSSLVEGVSGAAEYAGFFMPILILFFPFLLLWRWAWRWATRNSRAKVM